jgi:hypothetical protein
MVDQLRTDMKQQSLQLQGRFLVCWNWKEYSNCPLDHLTATGFYVKFSEVGRAADASAAANHPFVYVLFLSS